MSEFFIYANSFAAPFVSDISEDFVTAKTAEAALKKFVVEYKHPAGLYSAAVYRDANAFHKGKEPLARWICNHETEKQRITEGLGAYSFRSNGPGDFEINGKNFKVTNPKGGQITVS